jgi:hypothetical protein
MALSVIGTLRGRLWARDAFRKKRNAHTPARNTMSPTHQSTAATIRNNQRPYHRTGKNRRIVTKHHKTPECSNGYRLRSRCDSRRDCHKRRRTIVQTYYGPVGDWRECKRTTQPNDKPSLRMGQPPIRGAYMISGAYGSALNDKIGL